MLAIKENFLTYASPHLILFLPMAGEKVYKTKTSFVKLNEDSLR